MRKKGERYSEEERLLILRDYYSSGMSAGWTKSRMILL